jgi:hypothetical protein
MATEPRLEHQTLKVRQLVEDYRAGRIRVAAQQGTTLNRLALPGFSHFVASSRAERRGGSRAPTRPPTDTIGSHELAH